MYKNKLPKLNNCNVGVIGLGYVGLPLALQIANQKKCLKTQKKLNRKIIGYDLNKLRIEELKDGIDRNNVFSKKIIKETKNIKFTNNKNLLKNIEIFIITVPTPIDIENKPNLHFIKEASKIVGESIRGEEGRKSNPIVIFESTVYPGVTEEICIPIVEEFSCKKYNSKNYYESFYSGYSPERINPGDLENTLDSIIKVTSGCNKKVSDWIDNFYGSIISAGTYKASSIKVAEAAKIIENTQRDINIALVNELAILFKKMNINTQEVLNTANTKWNFKKYVPGLVGGHCIGVDPYYLTYKAKEIGYNTKLIVAGRKINDFMHEYLLEQIVIEIGKRKNFIKSEKFLLLGLSYKANCADIRNSQLISLVENIKKRDIEITIVDPKVNNQDLINNNFIALDNIPKNKKFSVIIFALYHNEFKNIKDSTLAKISDKDTIIFDLTNTLSGSNIFTL